jgi:hypothetical protein
VAGARDYGSTVPGTKKVKNAARPVGSGVGAGPVAGGREDAVDGKGPAGARTLPSCCMSRNC